MTQTPQIPYGPGQAPMHGGMFPPQAAPPAPPAKKPLYKRTWFLILAGLVVLAIFASQSGGGDSASSDASAGASADAPSDGSSDASSGGSSDVAEDSSAVAMGETAADGKFSFVVDKLDCSLTKIGDEYFNTTAQGKFCIVDVTITNVGDEPQSFFGDNAKLFNAGGQEFSADSEASMYLKDSESLYAEINPGNTLKSRVIFDVPKDMKPASIELHDSAFSGGVTVDLT